MYSSTAGTTPAQTLLELSSIVDNLLLLLSDKERQVVQKRFNLNGKGKHTLEEIGQEFSVTRERIRQIEKNALSKMKRNVFNTALRSLHEHVVSLVKGHGGLMRKDTLVSELGNCVTDPGKVHLDSLDLSLSLHDEFEAVGNTINFFPYVRDRNVPDYSLKHVANHLVNQLHKYGDVRDVHRVHNDLRHVMDEAGFDLEKTKSLIDIDKRITLLDNELVALMEWRHIHPRTLRDKIAYILRQEKAPMHFHAIGERISDAKFDGRDVNIQAVHNELIRHDSFVLIGRGIYALSEWGYERGTVAEVIERILQEKEELAQDEIVELVLKRRQVKRITILLSLKNHERFVRVGRRRYRLKV